MNGARIMVLRAQQVLAYLSRLYLRSYHSAPSLARTTGRRTTSYFSVSVPEDTYLDWLSASAVDVDGHTVLRRCSKLNIITHPHGLRLSWHNNEADF